MPFRYNWSEWIVALQAKGFPLDEAGLIKVVVRLERLVASGFPCEITDELAIAFAYALIGKEDADVDGFLTAWTQPSSAPPSTLSFDRVNKAIPYSGNHLARQQARFWNVLIRVASEYTQDSMQYQRAVLNTKLFLKDHSIKLQTSKLAEDSKSPAPYQKAHIRVASEYRHDSREFQQAVLNTRLFLEHDLIKSGRPRTAEVEEDSKSLPPYKKVRLSEWRGE